MSIRLLTLVLLIAAGCSRAPNGGGVEPAGAVVARTREADVVPQAAPGNDVAKPEAGEFRGHYAFGFEADGFTPCGSAESWWVTEDAGLRSRYKALGVRPYETVFAVVRGRIGAPGRYGHMGRYVRELAIEAVVEVRVATEQDCGPAAQP